MISWLFFRVLKRYRLFLQALFVVATSVPACSEIATLPMTIDYPMLQSLVVRTAFTGPDATARISDDKNGCWDVIIAQPEFFEKDGLLQFRTKVHADAGLYMFKKCILPMRWEGYVTLVQAPKISPDWALSFDTIDSSVHDLQMKPATLAGVVWDLIKTTVHEYLSGITLDLSPPVLDLKNLLRSMVSTDLRQRTERMIERLRPGVVSTGAGALGVEIRMEVEPAGPREAAPDSEIPPDSASAGFIENWETFDSFLVFLLTTLSEGTLVEDERRTLLDVLLEARYRFVDELTADRYGKDFVREQFLSSWEKLSPIFRRQAREDTATNLIGYLAFFTAIDALTALDKVGPDIGIEISRNGLLRLISMISDKGESALEYTLDVDLKLRDLLGFGPPLGATQNPHPPEPKSASAGPSNWLRLGPPPAWAESQSAGEGVRAIVEWVFDPSEIETYTDRIRNLIQAAVDATLKKGNAQGRFHQVLPTAAFSTAWQESCFRQFTTKGDKIVILRSYNGTSVGLMQVNERIWRGIYDQQSLRWDILYNARAGCEIIGNYFQKYAVEKIDSKKLPDDAALAGLVYAMYNGGPGQRDKYLERRHAGKLYLSDRLFMEKLAWVKENRWENIRKCLVGD